MVIVIRQNTTKKEIRQK